MVASSPAGVIPRGCRRTRPTRRRPLPARPPLLEICERTPGHAFWQQSVWLSHCERPCAFLCHAGSEDLQPIFMSIWRSPGSGCLAPAGCPAPPSAP
ncbi:CbrC family protein [uncultured Stenotrophomonas sp.]|uniref:CbrC family protein n=1 Tax=uncultured Stenotrophomonas sp. TaxID=165438 RepID=UPI0025E31B43|nr:CbrC family protein [uncultured Stenotrophomonas sp.]